MAAPWQPFARNGGTITRMNAERDGNPARAVEGPDALVTRHGLLVRRIAHHLVSRLPASVHIDDLLQAGMLGLLEAAQHYDPEQGASFETYAGIRIRGAMLDELRRYDWTPRSVHRKAREIAEAIRVIEMGKGRDARDSEVAAELKLSLPEYHQALQDSLACRVLSIEELLDSSGDAAWDHRSQPNAEPGETLVRDNFATALGDAIASLPERERLILGLYYDDERNLREIGEILGITESRVCQIQGQALLRLRARLSGWLDEAADGRRPVAARRARRAKAKAMPVTES